jgi:hypothetical protein
MAKKKKEETGLGGILAGVAEESIFVIINALKKGILNPFPSLMKKLSYKLVMKYVWLAVFGISGLVILGMGVGELLSELTTLSRGISHAIIGIAVLLFAVIQYKDRINIF